MKKKLIIILEIALSPLTVLSGIWLKFVRNKGFLHFPLTRDLLLRIGVIPITDHYYDPLVQPSELKSLRVERKLPAINLNISEQLELIKKFNFNTELEAIPIESKGDELRFYYNNGSFKSGDAEFYFNLIRLNKPSRIYEIGCGFTTLLAIEAISLNKKNDPLYNCRQVCIEPYEIPWLEKTGVEVLRKKVEDVDLSFFSDLQENDILFIDSSHMIRPQGDILFEYLQLIPTLNKGVIIHVHDIFTPFDYLDEWVKERVWLWNEQYILEAFLSCNKDFKIIGAVNYLKNKYFNELSLKSPVLKNQPEREPGSFWLQKI